MASEIFEALNMLQREKGISKGFMLEKIELALLSAVKKTYKNVENIQVQIDEVKGTIIPGFQKVVVENVEDITDDMEQITLDDARKISKKLNIGDTAFVEIKTKEFGRISAQTAKQVIVQGIREAERTQVIEEYNSKEHELLTATVTKIDSRDGKAFLDLGKMEAVLLQNEQIPGEILKEGDHIKVYVVSVRRGEKEGKVLISRTNPGLVRRLLELEVPEIFDGTVEIKSISRKPGLRTKVAVISLDENVDATSACIGKEATRINKIVNELKGEKIDIVNYSENIEEFVASSLAPAKVILVKLLEPTVETPDMRAFRVYVSDDQLSLAIGKLGVNAALAARLTGCKIDIKPESEMVE